MEKDNVSYTLFNDMTKAQQMAFEHLLYSYATITDFATDITDEPKELDFD